MTKIPLVSAVVSVAVLVGVAVAYRISVEEVEFVVSKTEVKRTGRGEDARQIYLVYSDKETFEVTDSVLFLRFDSSDLYGQILAGKRYRAQVAGWRVPLLSAYRNILSIERGSDE